MEFRVVEQADLGGEFEGYLFGSEVTFIFEREARAGIGPRLHRHPYTETFVLRSGAVRFTVGADELVATGGQVVVVPAMTPHKFVTIGSEVYEALHIHANDRFITEWLE